MIKKYEVVYVPGTWDLFHVGHVNILRRASRIAKRLIVGVDTDDSVRRDKKRLPVMPFRDRVKMLKACRYVSTVVPNEHNIPSVVWLRMRKIGAIVLGSDWENRHLPGRSEAEEGNIKIIYFPYTKNVSTTKLRNAYRETNE